MENVHSRRFQIALALALLLMVTSIVSLAITHQEDAAAHSVSQNTVEAGRAFDSFNTVQAEVGKVLQRPNALSVFVGGPADDYRRSATVQGETTETGGGSDSPTNQRFDPLDLGFVSIVVMTLMAVLLAYDAISGERERGTLKLLLTNPVAKDTVLLGKYLGGMASVLLPFGISLVVALAVFQFLGVPMAAAEWGRLALIIVMFVPLASAFYLIGLLMSSVTRRSNTSLIALLLVWLVLVFGAGNVAAVAAKTTSDAANGADVLLEFQAIRSEEQARIQEINEQLMPLFRQNPGENRSAETTAEIERLQKEMQQVFEESETRRNEALDAMHRRLDAQLQRAEGIAALSLAEAYRGIATALAKSDYWSYKYDLESADVYLAEVERVRQEWQEDQGISGDGVFVIRVASPGGSSFEVTPFEAPEFTHRPQSLAEQVTSGHFLRDLMVLVVYNILGFVGAYVAFLRYDVR